MRHQDVLRLENAHAYVFYDQWKPTCCMIKRYIIMKNQCTKPECLTFDSSNRHYNCIDKELVMGPMNCYVLKNKMF